MTESSIDITDYDQRLIAGWASVAVIDRQGDLVDIDALKKAMLVLMDRGGNIFYGHKNAPVGKILKWDVKEHELTKQLGVYLIVKINSGYEFDDAVWKALKEGKLKGFSIAGKGTGEKGWIDKDGRRLPARILKKLQLNEISIVDEPANQHALIEQIAVVAKCYNCEGCETDKCTCNTTQVEPSSIEVTNNSDDVKVSMSGVNFSAITKEDVVQIMKDHIEDWKTHLKQTHADEQQEKRKEYDNLAYTIRQMIIDMTSTGGKSTSGKEGYTFNSKVIDTVMANLDRLDQDVGVVKSLLKSISLDADLSAVIADIDKGDFEQTMRNINDSMGGVNPRHLTPNSPQRCKYCGEKVKNVGDAVNHQQTRHPDKPYGRFQGSDTGYSNTTQRLNKSTEEPKETDPKTKPYQCKTCGRKLKNEMDAGVHERMTGEYTGKPENAHQTVPTSDKYSSRSQHMFKSLDDVVKSIEELDKSIATPMPKNSSHAPYKCKTCGTKLKDQGEAAAHQVSQRRVGDQHEVEGSSSRLSYAHQNALKSD